jgi:cytochrome P450
MSVTDSRPQTVEFDHNSAEYAQHWREIYGELRGRCPVAHSEAYGGYYVLTRYKDVERALKDDATFASLHSTEAGSPYGGILIPPSPNVSTPIEMDPPDFTPLRKLLNPYFSPGKGDEWEPFTRDVTTGLIDQVIESGRMDLVDQLASPVPALLTAGLLGLPLADWRMYSDVSHAIVYTPPTDPRFMDVVTQLQEINERATSVGLQRRQNPQDDLLSAIATYRDANGELLPEHRITEFCSLIIGGGNDTTTSLLSQAFIWLSEHPDQRDWLREDTTRIKTACEEFLRYFTPTQALARTVTRSVEIGGYELQPGDRVLLSFASANQDPEEFENPDEIILDRFPNRHQAFGLGLHRCLGSNFTRMEFRVVLEEVLERLPDFVVDPAGSERYESIGIVNGWATMPATFTPGTRKGSTFQP